MGAWDVAQEGRPGSGVGWKAEQKEPEREVRKVLSAEDTQLGEALH